MFKLWPDGMRPHPGQARVWSARQGIVSGQHPRMVLLPCGRRWGKDLISAKLCLFVGLKLLEQRSSSSLHPKVHHWIVGPTDKLTDQLWREMKNYTVGLPRRINETRKRISIKGGEYLIECRSSHDPESLVGVGLDILHVTEAAQIRDAAWHENLEPCLYSPGRLGFACLNGTPGTSPASWYVKAWKRAMDGDPSILLVNEPSWENPHLTPAQLKEIGRKVSEISERVWRSTYGACLVPDAGGVFRYVLEAATEKPGPRKDCRRYLAFWDTASSVDFNAISVFGIRDGHLHQVYVDRWQGGWEESLPKLAGLKPYPGALFIDISGTNIHGHPSVQMVRRHLGSGFYVSGYKFDNANKEAMTEHMALRLEQRTVSLIDPAECSGPTRDAASAQVRELEAWRPFKLPSGLVRYAAPEGEHDDMAVACMASAMLAVHRFSDAGKAFEALGAMS